MVFHTESKRRSREKPQAESHTTFLDLPDELVLAILERTDSISEQAKSLYQLAAA
jgi:hypothetical protein